MKTKKVNKSVGLILTTTLFVICAGLLVMLTPSCKKNTDQEKSHLTVRMTDAPGDFDAVMVDVVGVEVICDQGTILLNTEAGIYNLLDYSNGLNALIATGDLDAGTVSQIRLILGSNNTVMVDSIVYPLSTPSAMQSGLKLMVHQTFEPGVAYSIMLDFDANQSVILKGNGEYQLKPVIRTIDAAISGSIKGSVTPVGTMAVVTATSDGISYSTIVHENGEFLIAGLPAGTYEIKIDPVLPLLPVTITGKVVVVGTSTDLGIVAL
jgi:hypothetical protein